MQNEPSNSEEKIFEVASNLPPEKRAAYVEVACGSDAAMRSRVMRLLDSHEATVFMQPGAGAANRNAAGGPGRSGVDLPRAECTGDRIGDYKLLQEIGEGGFGVVWMADQQRPVRRRVALKIIKLGMDTKEVVARFEQERQALALMSHPNIAKVFDAGATAYGRPYFVMELIRGKKITEFCDEAGLGVRERLKLFVDVCKAVQHAHQKAIIHRDIKPSNVLVTVNDGEAVVKVIDFGVAKAIQGRLTDKTFFTSFEQMIGTPIYMAPEQAELTSLDVDTRSDIYSLGVVLYELLSGRTPIDAESLSHEGIDRIRQIIREVEPPRPSNRVRTLNAEELTTVAKRRRVEPAKLPGLIRGDLDWIVMKCIEKDRKRRYETANDLAMDIERHLANEPVVARPPSYPYLIGRFIRRNRLPVGAAAAVAVALIIGAVASRWQALKAMAERDAKEKALVQARAAEEDTKAFGDFLVNRVLAAARPQDVEGGLGIDVTVVRALEQAEHRLDRDFADRPRAEAVAREGIGVTWETLGRHTQAARQLEMAILLREKGPPPDESGALKTMNNLAVVYQKAGNVDLALPLFERVMLKRKAALPSDHPDLILSMNNLAGAYFDASQIPKALALYEQTLDASMSALGADDVSTLKTMGNLARALRAASAPDTALVSKALPLYERAFDRSIAKLGADHPDTLTCMNNLAVCYEQAGRVEAALPLYEGALKVSRSKLGENHPDTLTSMSNAAGVYFKTGRMQEAVGLYEEVLAGSRARPGADDRETLIAIVNLAVAYEKAGQFQKAVPLYAEALDKKIATLGSDHGETLKAMNNLAVAHSEAREFGTAIPLFLKAFEKRKAALGSEHPDTLKSLFNVALAYWEMKDFRKALDCFEELLALKRKRLGEGDPQIADLERRVAEARVKVQESAGNREPGSEGEPK